MAIFRNRKRINDLEGQIASLTLQVQEGITEGTEAMHRSSATAKSRLDIVKAIADRYRGQADYGNEFVQRIVNFRSGIITGGGMKPVIVSSADEKKEEGASEKEFIESFMNLNDLYDFQDQELGVEKEIEGQLLFSLRWDAVKELPVVIYYPWSATNYKVTLDDTGVFKEATWTDKGSKSQVVTESNGVFMKFNARKQEPNGWPTLSGNLDQCDNISKALKDWRAINNLHSCPTPYFKTEGDNAMRDAKGLLELIRDAKFNWRPGKLFAGPATYELIGMDLSGVESIKKEIETNAKILSGGTDVPLQFLGLPEFMSNRATAENTMEPIGISSTSEQSIWTSGMQELFDKAILMRNESAASTSRKLEVGLVEPQIQFVTEKQLKRVIEIYMPLWEKNGLTLATLLNMLPDIPEDEIDNVNQEAEVRSQEQAAQAALLVEKLRASKEPDNDEGDVDEEPVEDGQAGDLKVVE